MTRHSRSRSWRIIKWLVLGLLLLFVLINTMAAIHAWKFTHFSSGGTKTGHAEKLTSAEKIKVLFTGVNLPRPENESHPIVPFKTVTFNNISGNRLEGWLIPTDSSNGTIILFHGYGSCKSKMLDAAMLFRQMGFQTLMVDFTSSGGSSGNRTTIGYDEADDVIAAYSFVSNSLRETRIILFGTSMGAAAIARACYLYNDIKPQCLLLECPYGSMLDAVKNRFQIMGIPSFPLSQLLVFYGGLENGFWAFDHDVVRYSRDIHIPTLLLYGLKDERVTLKETNEIFSSLAGRKSLHVFEKAGHQSYCSEFPEEWKQTVYGFLKLTINK